jgi:hypothetical protein
MDDTIPVSRHVPPDFHPETLRGDDIPTRAGKHGLTGLYTTWDKLGALEREVKDKSKLLKHVGNEMVRALAKSEETVKHIQGLEKNNDNHIRNELRGKKDAYSAELRAFYKGKFSELVRAAEADLQTAGAVWDCPAVLLGLTPEQASILRDRIEAAHVPDSYRDRKSARAAIAKLEAARERFGRHYMVKMGQWESSDDVLIAAAGKVE